MIRFAHTCFQYADSGDGVEDIGLHVRKGECVVLTGPSGNGKTTLTRLVNGLAPAFYAGRLSGAVELGGRDRREEPLWQRGRLVGSVFQDPKSQFFSSQLAGEVAFACENYGIPHDEIVSRTDAAIRAFRLEGLRDRPLDVLSSGEKQRTAMASVCALDPPVLVCDEPTANLDEQGIRELRDALLQFKREGRTLLIAEHRLAWLVGLADRFVYVREGRLRREKTPEQMLGMTEEERERLQLRSVREGAPAALPPPTGGGGPRRVPGGPRLRAREKMHLGGPAPCGVARPGDGAYRAQRGGKDHAGKNSCGAGAPVPGRNPHPRPESIPGAAAEALLVQRQRYRHAVFHEQRLRRAPSGPAQDAGRSGPRPGAFKAVCSVCV